jgi:hypothetical protein
LWSTKLDFITFSFSFVVSDIFPHTKQRECPVQILEILSLSSLFWADIPRIWNRFILFFSLPNINTSQSYFQFLRLLLVSATVYLSLSWSVNNTINFIFMSCKKFSGLAYCAWAGFNSSLFAIITLVLVMKYPVFSIIHVFFACNATLIFVIRLPKNRYSFGLSQNFAFSLLSSILNI